MLRVRVHMFLRVFVCLCLCVCVNSPAAACPAITVGDVIVKVNGCALSGKSVQVLSLSLSLSLTLAGPHYREGGWGANGVWSDVLIRLGVRGGSRRRRRG